MYCISYAIYPSIFFTMLSPHSIYYNHPLRLKMTQKVWIQAVSTSVVKRVRWVHLIYVHTAFLWKLSKNEDIGYRAKTINNTI
jgi:hypothetical protein